MDRGKVFDLIDQEKEQLFTFLSELVRIDSQNFGAYGNEVEIAENLKNAYEKIGLKAEVYSPLEVPGLTENIDYYPGRHLEGRRNVSVEIPGTGSGRKLMLAAHTDTVPIGNRENWSFDPLCGEIRDGKIFGRGACDDKYGLALMWFLVKLFRENGIKLPYDLILAAYCDEEFGGGNGALAASLKHRPDDIVNLDGRIDEIDSAGAGGGEMEGMVHTTEPQDSCEKLIDGIQIVREELLRFKEERRRGFLKRKLFQDTIIPDTCLRFLEIDAGGDLSLNAFKIRVVFYTCENEEETMRELDVLKTEINSRLHPLGMEFGGFSITTRFFRFSEGDAENPALEQIRDCIRLVSGEEMRSCGSSLSDLPLMINHGSRRAFSYGAGRGFDQEGGSHQPDEFIECSSLLKLTKIVAAFLLTYGDNAEEDCGTKNE